MFTDNGGSLTISFDLPFPVSFAQFALALTIFGLLVFAGAWLLTHGPEPTRRLVKAVRSWWPKGDTLADGITRLALVLSPFGIILALISIWRLGVLLVVPPSAEGAVDFRVHYLAFVGVATFLIGLVGIPFAIARVRSTERQTRAQEEGLITDRINKAVEGLGAEKTISRMGRTVTFRIERDGLVVEQEHMHWRDLPPKQDTIDAISPPVYGQWTIFNETVPNLEVRIGAIYALERIAQDSLRDHIQIMEILCAYIRENAPASSAKKLPEPPEYYEGVSDAYDGVKRLWSGYLLDDDGKVVIGSDGKPIAGAFNKWRQDLRKALEGVKPRADIQTALTVIGRRSRKQKELEWGDWRPYEEVVTDWPEWSANSDGTASDAYTSAVEQHRQALRTWKLIKPRYRFDLRETNLQGADMSAAANAADFSLARFDRSEAQGAVFSEAQAQGASFYQAQVQTAHFLGAKAQRADFYKAKVQGADFYKANVQGAVFTGAQFDEKTRFTAAKFLFAAVKSCSFDGIGITQEQIDASFGDLSTNLPDGVSRPRHWPDWDMDWMDFNNEWQKWQSEGDAYVPPPKPVENIKP